jgi:alkylhydroperoxidase family enzyme
MSALAKQQGLTDQHIAGLLDRPVGLFTDTELAVLDLAEALYNDASGSGADQELMARMHSHFSDGALLELTWAIGQFIGIGKMVAFFGLERDFEV